MVAADIVAARPVSTDGTKRPCAALVARCRHQMRVDELTQHFSHRDAALRRDALDDERLLFRELDLRPDHDAMLTLASIMLTQRIAATRR